MFSSSAVYIIDTRDRVYIWSGEGASNRHKSVAEVTLKALQVCVYISTHTHTHTHTQYIDRQTDVRGCGAARRVLLNLSTHYFTYFLLFNL